MKAPRRTGSLRRVWACVFMLLGSCSPGPNEKTGTQTNWLVLCSSDSECGDLDCTCGVCSSECEDDAECSGFENATCIGKSDPGAIAVCGGQAPAAGICLPRCSVDECPTGTCIAGVCDATRTPDMRVTIDIATEHQALVGFGASLAYAEDRIADHPQREALLDVMFTESGFDMLRMRNRFEGNNAAELESVSAIVAAATTRIGHTPAILITEGTPPAALKANGEKICAGNPESCTLARDAESGAFVYAAFADHWRASLDAHVAAGVVPDYLSIQNNPDWSPPEEAPLEACRFLPEEGEESVMIDGTPTAVAYPGYNEAFAAVREALNGADYTVRFVAPEAGSLGGVNDFVTRLDRTTYDAIGFHLYYAVDATDIDVAPFHEVRDLAEAAELPAFQTEMRADGLATAVLLHYSVTEGNAAVYLQNDFVSLDSDDPNALIALTDEDFAPQTPYYALRHFAHDTAPGWTRVDAIASAPDVLASAWLAPDADALTVVLVNPSDADVTLELALDQGVQSELARTEVTRTVFDGVERAAELGSLGADGVLSLPAMSMVTVALRR